MSRTGVSLVRRGLPLALLLGAACGDDGANEEAARRGGRAPQEMVVTASGAAPAEEASGVMPMATPAPAPSPAPTPAPPSPAPAPGPANPPAPTLPLPPLSDIVVRARDIEVDRLTAGLIIADKVEAEAGSIAHVHLQRDKRWQTEITDEDMDLPALTADLVYARNIKVRWLEAQQVWAREVHLPRDSGGKD
jgi:hypothetical protein